MSNASKGNTKQVFTPEQRLALGRVYGFLIELGRQRLNRLKVAGTTTLGTEGTSSENTTEKPDQMK
jgi:hypothetical protein